MSYAVMTDPKVRPSAHARDLCQFTVEGLTRCNVAIDFLRCMRVQDQLDPGAITTLALFSTDYDELNRLTHQDMITVVDAPVKCLVQVQRIWEGEGHLRKAIDIFRSWFEHTVVHELPKVRVAGPGDRYQPTVGCGGATILPPLTLKGA